MECLNFCPDSDVSDQLFPFEGLTEGFSSIKITRLSFRSPVSP